MGSVVGYKKRYIMRIKAIVFGIVLVVFVISPACEKLDVSYEFFIEQEIEVVSSSKEFNVEEILNASDASSYIKDYGDNIKTIDILDVTYQLTRFNGPDDQQINTATLKVSDENGGGPVEISTVTNVNLLNALNNVQPLQVNPAGVDRLAALIKAPPHTAMLTLVGNANEGPMDIKVLFRFKVVMVAAPL